jgi:hypothetical protein
MPGVEGNPYRLHGGLNAARDEADANMPGTLIGR